MTKVTVLMPVFNGEKYIQEAIDSVLRQSFQDFELLIVDDGSTDNTLALIRNYKDKRIRLETRGHDFIGNLNEGLRLARGKYVARMDADDIMHTERLQVQVRLMEKHPELTVCGTWMKNFGEGVMPHVFRPSGGEIVAPLLQMLKGNILFHPTVMFRKSFLWSQHIQYQHYQAAEDYKLYVEIAKAGGVFYIEPQVLLFYRCSSLQVTQNKQQEMICTSLSIRREIVKHLIIKHEQHNSHLRVLYEELKQMEADKLLGSESLFRLFFEIFVNIEKLYPLPQI